MGNDLDMEKVKAFFKKVGSIMYDLFIASNRWKHLIAGCIVYLAVMVSMSIWTPFDPVTWQCAFGSTIASLIVMMALEYKDKAHGGLFDWKDILAGVTVPIVGDIVIIFLKIFSNPI